jgi:hypothetical protein
VPDYGSGLVLEVHRDDAGAYSLQLAFLNSTDQ